MSNEITTSTEPKSLWASKTVITSIITGVVAVLKGIGTATGAFEIPDGTVESLLTLIFIFLRAGVQKAQLSIKDIIK